MFFTEEEEEEEEEERPFDATAISESIGDEAVSMIILERNP